MRVSGTAELRAPLECVYAALTDPRLLAPSIPGCQGVEPGGVDEYWVTVTVGAAVHRGHVLIGAHEPPRSCVVRARWEGGAGVVEASAYVRLIRDGNGTTHLTYDADVEGGGLPAGMARLLASGPVHRLVADLIATVDRQLLEGRMPGRMGPSALVAVPGPG